MEKGDSDYESYSSQEDSNDELYKEYSDSQFDFVGKINPLVLEKEVEHERNITDNVVGDSIKI